MAQRESARRTLTELHEEVTRFDAKIEKQKGILRSGGRNVIKEFTPAEDAAPEDIISGIYDAGRRRILLTNRIEHGSLPYLQEKKDSVKEVQDDAIAQAREAYEGIQTLARLGVCSPDEKTLLEDAISRLPENVAIQIRTSPTLIPEQRTEEVQLQQEPKRGFLARILGRRRQKEKNTQVIDAAPHPIGTSVSTRTTVVEDKKITPAQQPPIVEKTEKSAPSEPSQRVPFQGEIPDVSAIVGKKANLQNRMLTAIFEATVAGDNFTKNDYARKLFEHEIREGTITEGKAVQMFIDSLQWVQRKAKISGYEIYHLRDDKGIVYRISARKGSENVQKPSGEELSVPQDAFPTTPAEATDENTLAETKFPDGRFLGKEEDSARKIYSAIIDFSSNGKLPAGEDLIKALFTQDIASGAITQDQARIRVRDGLNRLRGKLKDTGMELTNKGTLKFPFYKLEVKGEIPDRVWNPPVSQRVAVSTLTERSQTTTAPQTESNRTVLSADGEEVSLPSPDVVGKAGTIRRRYYEFLLAKKADGVITTIEEEADYLYGEHSHMMLARIYAMRQQLNQVLEPHGVRIGAEKRRTKESEEHIPTETAAAPAPTPEPEVLAEKPELYQEATIEREAAVAEQPATEIKEEQTGKIKLRGGERRTLQMLDGTSETNSMTTDEIAAKFFPDKRIKKDEIITIQTFIAGLKSFSLTGTEIRILHPLTQDGNPVLNRHYLKLPEGKTLEDLVDFELSPTSQQPAAEKVERIAVSVANIDLERGKPVELPPAIPESIEVTLPHFLVDETRRLVSFAGQKIGFRFADEWEVFNRIAHKPNQELTPHELAGLDPNIQDAKGLERAENSFRHFITRFEQDPNNPQTFIITGGNRYPKFTFRATTEFVSDPDKSPNGHTSQWE